MLTLRELGLDKYSLGEEFFSLGLDNYKCSLGEDKFSLGEDKYSLGEDKFSLGEDKHSLGEDKFSLGESKHCTGESKHSDNSDKYSQKRDKFSTGEATRHKRFGKRDDNPPECIVEEIASRLYEADHKEPFDTYGQVWTAYVEMTGQTKSECTDSMRIKTNKVFVWEAHKLLCDCKRAKRQRTV